MRNYLRDHVEAVAEFVMRSSSEELEREATKRSLKTAAYMGGVLVGALIIPEVGGLADAAAIAGTAGSGLMTVNHSGHGFLYRTLAFSKALSRIQQETPVSQPYETSEQ